MVYHPSRHMHQRLVVANHHLQVDLTYFEVLLSGQIIDGETTLEDIANTKVGPQDKPLHDVVIESIDVEEFTINDLTEYCMFLI
jgi:cyclophilin family peptidyl-prolyl cis-trans isomerase